MTQAAVIRERPNEVTPEDVVTLRSRAIQLKRTDMTNGAAYAYDAAQTHGFEAVRLMGAPCPAELRVPLAESAAWLLGVVGFMSHDLGHERRAAQWYGQAHSAAKAAHNWSVVARTLGLQARQEVATGEPIMAQRRIATALERVGELEPHEAAMLYALLARACAAEGDVPRTLNAIELADTWNAIEGTDQARARSPWSAHYDKAHHDGDVAAALRLLADHGHADAATAAVDRYGLAYHGAQGRTKSLVIGSLSTLHLLRGIPERGVVLGHEAVFYCEQQHIRSERMNAHFDHMLTALAATDFAGANELAERVRDHMVATGASA